MIDFSGLPMAQIEAAVAAEKQRRRDDVLAALRECAARHGLTLADIAGLPPKRVHGNSGRKANRPLGVVWPEIAAKLRDGKLAKDIAAEHGYKNSGAVYVAAKRAGLTIFNGRAVL